MPSPAIHTDVEARWRPLNSQEITNANTFLEDAWRSMRRRVPDLTTRLAVPGATDLTQDVISVLVTAVLRVMKNPDGSKRETADDASWEPKEAAASGLLYLTDEELDLVRAAPVGYIGPAYVISLGR